MAAISTDFFPLGGSAVLSFKPYLGRTISLIYNCPGLCSTTRVTSSPIFLYKFRSMPSGSITTRSRTGRSSIILRFFRSRFLSSAVSLIASTAISCASLISEAFSGTCPLNRSSWFGSNGASFSDLRPKS